MWLKNNPAVSKFWSIGLIALLLNMNTQSCVLHRRLCVKLHVHVHMCACGGQVFLRCWCSPCLRQNFSLSPGARVSARLAIQSLRVPFFLLHLIFSFYGCWGTSLGPHGQALSYWAISQPLVHSLYKFHITLNSLGRFKCIYGNVIFLSLPSWDKPRNPFFLESRTGVGHC